MGCLFCYMMFCGGLCNVKPNFLQSLFIRSQQKTCIYCETFHASLSECYILLAKDPNSSSASHYIASEQADRLTAPKLVSATKHHVTPPYLLMMATQQSQQKQGDSTSCGIILARIHGKKRKT